MIPTDPTLLVNALAERDHDAQTLAADVRAVERKRSGNPPDSPWRSTPRAKRGARTGRVAREVPLSPETWAKVDAVAEARGKGRPEALEAMIAAYEGDGT